MSPAEVSAAMAALATPHPAAVWSELRAAGLLHPAAQVPG